MRVISGRLKGTLFDAPNGHATHPMSEKARGGIFNSLGDITDLTVLDAFAGSGALSFEAVSRGAKSAVAIEKDFKAFKVLNQNVSKLNLTDQVKAIRANNASWSQTSTTDTFDIVLCDPPYKDWKLSRIKQMSRHVAEDGLLVVSFPSQNTVPSFESFTHLDTKVYGDASIGFWKSKQ